MSDTGAADLAKRFYSECLEDLERDRLVLPTLPEVALKVREVVDSTSSTIGDITRVIGTDAALSARIIQVANSPLMRPARRIESLDVAVARLGMKLVRDMATSMVMQQLFQATAEVTDRLLHELWGHAVQVAAISHALALRCSDLDPEEAMLAGLVHDIGALPLIARAEDFPSLLENEALLKSVVYKLHTHIGAAILKAWHFPEELVVVALRHEEILRDSARADYLDVVIVANLQSHLGARHPHARQDWHQVPAFAKLGLDPEVSVVDMAETAVDIEETRRLLEG